MSVVPPFNCSLFKKRREQVISFLRQEHPEVKNGMIILFGGFESERYAFRQESSFYYLTGIVEPGAVLCSYLDGREILYLPNYGPIREKWSRVNLKPDEKSAREAGVSQIKYLGQSCGGYVFNSLFTKEKYENLLMDIDGFLQASMIQKTQPEFFTILDNLNSKYFTQIRLYKNLMEYFPAIANMTRDLAPLVHYLRRFKSEIEIDLIYKAVQITNMAHEAAAQVISPGRFEYELQAVIESVFTQAGAFSPAFPSIIATGENTTVLHYMQRNQELKPQDLVVVDVGAEYGYYASDLTRTYPVDGKFNERQLEIYNAVLDTQMYIESIAKPGMFLNNKEDPEKSLNHLAIKYLDKKGLAKYFAHSIGHFMGLDVHDVGDSTYPLGAGDIFTIEPGIYIPEENLGVRIEDNYLMTDEGAVCLSYQLPRKAEEIEAMMKEL